MKVLIVTTLLLVATESLYAQNYGQNNQSALQGTNPPNQDLYLRKIHTYTKMQYWGIGFLAVGGASLFTGIILVANNPAVTTPQYNNYYGYSGNPATIKTYPHGHEVGITFIEAGAICLVPGIIFAAIGGGKETEYKRKAGLSIGMATKGAGLSLTYRF